MLGYLSPDEEEDNTSSQSHQHLHPTVQPIIREKIHEYHEYDENHLVFH